MSSNQDKNLMDQIINWKEQIGCIAGPFLPTDTKQSWLARAARRASLSLRHVQSLYYGHVTDPKFSVAASILNAADKAKIEETKRDVAKVAGLYLSHAQKLETIDADFHRQQIDALVGAARILSGGNIPRKSGEVK